MDTDARAPLLDKVDAVSPAMLIRDARGRRAAPLRGVVFQRETPVPLWRAKWRSTRRVVTIRQTIGHQLPTNTHDTAPARSREPRVCLSEKPVRSIRVQLAACGVAVLLSLALGCDDPPERSTIQGGRAGTESRSRGGGGQCDAATEGNAQ